MVGRETKSRVQMLEDAKKKVNDDFIAEMKERGVSFGKVSYEVPKPEIVIPKTTPEDREKLVDAYSTPKPKIPPIYDPMYLLGQFGELIRSQGFINQQQINDLIDKNTTLTTKESGLREQSHPDRDKLRDLRQRFIEAVLGNGSDSTIEYIKNLYSELAKLGGPKELDKVRRFMNESKIWLD